MITKRRVLAFIGAVLFLILGWDARTYWAGAGGFSRIVYPALIFYAIAGFVLLWWATDYSSRDATRREGD